MTEQKVGATEHEGDDPGDPLAALLAPSASIAPPSGEQPNGSSKRRSGVIARIRSRETVQRPAIIARIRSLDAGRRSGTGAPFRGPEVGRRSAIAARIRGFGDEPAIGPVSVRLTAICVAASFAAAILAYGVGKLIPATYQSSGLLRVAVPAQGGVNDPVVLAANDSATQYALLATTEPVARLSAEKLGVPESRLRGTISGSTVSAQNLVQVTVTGDSPGSAVARASAATVSLARYITLLNARESNQYVARVQRGLAQSNATLRSLTARLATDSPAERTADTSMLQTLDSQHAQMLEDVARDAAGDQPSVQVVNPSSPATVLSPQPKLYALVVFVVALIVSIRAAFVVSRRHAR